MRFLRQNTAVRITVGPFLDPTDGVTPETALTVTNCKITMMVDDDDGTAANLVIDAAATASGGNNDMVHVTGDDAGFYDLELTAAQTNYLGRAMLAITDAANHCPVFHEFMIVSQGVYDKLFGTYSATRGLAGTALPDAAADAAGGIPISDAGGLDLDAKLANTNEVTTARMGALTDWIDGGRLDLILDARASQASVNLVQASLDIITGGDGVTLATLQPYYAPLTSLGATSPAGWVNAASFAADVDAEARGWIGLAAANLDTQLADLPTVAEFGARTLVAASYGTAANQAAIAGYIDTEVGTILTELAKVPKSDGIVTWNATALASIQQEATDALNAYDPPTNAEMEARTLPAADYVVVGDTIAGVTSVGTVTGNVNGSVGSVTGAVGSVTGNVGGSVASVIAGVTLADGAHGGAAATLQLASFTSDGSFTIGNGLAIYNTSPGGNAVFIQDQAGGLAINVDGGIWLQQAITATSLSNDIRGVQLTANGLALISAWTVDITGTVSGNSTHNAAAVVSALGTGSTLTSLAQASTALSNATWTDAKAAFLDAAITSRSSHTAANVLTALGTGSWITAAQISATVGWGGAALPTEFAVNDKTGFSLANGTIVTATFGTCVLPKSPMSLAAADVTGNLSADVVNWKGAAAPAMTGDAYAYLGTNLGALGANATALAPASTALSTVVWTGTKAGYLDAAISGRQATITGIDTAVATVAKLDTTLVQDGVVYDFTSAALAAAPTGGGTPQTGDAYAYLTANLGSAGAAATESGGTGDHLTALATQAKQDAAKVVLDIAAADVANIDGAAMRGTDGAYTGTPATADAIGTDAASKILVTPAQKIATNASGQVEASNALTGAEMFAAVLTTQMTEAYAADGVAPTLAQAIFLIQQSLHEFAISGTTRTVKKLDGTTTAATFTLDDATAPTSTARAT